MVWFLSVQRFSSSAVQQFSGSAVQSAEDHDALPAALMAHPRRVMSGLPARESLRA
jgi:hypothetical protein